MEHGLSCPVAMWDLSSGTRDSTLSPAFQGRNVNPWSTREVPVGILYVTSFCLHNQYAPEFFMELCLFLWLYGLSVPINGCSLALGTSHAPRLFFFNIYLFSCSLQALLFTEGLYLWLMGLVASWHVGS